MAEFSDLDEAFLAALARIDDELGDDGSDADRAILIYQETKLNPSFAPMFVGMARLDAALGNFPPIDPRQAYIDGETLKDIIDRDSLDL